MSGATPLIPFEGGSAPSAGQIANDHSLLKIDQELDFLLERRTSSGLTAFPVTHGWMP
jgi:hypothetical protein